MSKDGEGDVVRLLPDLELRHLKRLRVHGLIKRIDRRYEYYVTEIGRRAIIAGLKLREVFVFPNSLCPPPRETTNASLTAES